MARIRQWNRGLLNALISLLALLWSGFLYSQNWHRSPEGNLVLLTIPLLVNTVFKVMIAAKATRLMGESRVNGELELLLTTPIRNHKVYRGFRRAINHEFKPTLFAVLAIDVATLIISTTSPRGPGADLALWLMVWAMIVMLLIDTWALIWIGLWEGARSRNSMLAFWRTLRNVFLFPLLAFVCTFWVSPVVLVYTTVLGREGFLLGSVIWWWVVGFITTAIYAYRARRSLREELRHYVSEPPAPGFAPNWMKRKHRPPPGRFAPRSP